ncbi:MAG: hypothetical protein ACTSSH_06305 [Candidatus Heimdallarchaeota archaeon]
MNRSFLFHISDLSYTKSDLNIPNTSNRHVIGQLARMITNALFLSHSLRSNITIRIFVSNPIPHLFQIKSETIRYLGPELRSSASILLKAEKFFHEEIISSLETKWFQPNPGLFLKLTDNPFVEIEEPFTLLSIHTQQDPKLDLQTISIYELEEIIKTNHVGANSLIFHFPLTIVPSLSIDEIKLPIKQHKVLLLDNNPPIPNIITQVNLMLDKLESR